MICPECGSNRLKRGDGNLWCADCGFFPIPFSQAVWRYWVSWWTSLDQKEFPQWIYWITGQRWSDNMWSCCMVMDATSPEACEQAIKAWFLDAEMRFCRLEAPDFQPPADRFPPPEDQ